MEMEKLIGVLTAMNFILRQAPIATASHFSCLMLQDGVRHFKLAVFLEQAAPPAWPGLEWQERRAAVFTTHCCYSLSLKIGPAKRQRKMSLLVLGILWQLWLNTNSCFSHFPLFYLSLTEPQEQHKM